MVIDSVYLIATCMVEYVIAVHRKITSTGRSCVGIQVDVSAQYVLRLVSSSHRLAEDVL